AFGWAYFEKRHNTWDQFYVYWICPFVGAILAAWLFHKTRELTHSLSATPPPKSNTHALSLPFFPSLIPVPSIISLFVPIHALPSNPIHIQHRSRSTCFEAALPILLHRPDPLSILLLRRTPHR
ncbi:unnamed protein product, partial [Sphenostylis stenocarpa]